MLTSLSGTYRGCLPSSVQTRSSPLTCTTRCACRYSSNQLPIIRDPHNAPVVLHEELGVGSLVRLAIGDDGMMRAVQIMQAAWADPFADVA
jgi:hypothetical protein